MKRQNINALAFLSVGACVGAWLHAVNASIERPAAAQRTSPTPASDNLIAQLESVKGKLPSQSHAMQDVGYHFSNLWFAAQQQNWELANFYWAETRSHLEWAVRIIPVRKDNAGRDVDLRPILEGFVNGPLKQLQEAIDAHDKAAFDKSYRTSLETCYGCHKTSDKPYLRLQIPKQPETPIINFDPNAEWP